MSATPESAPSPADLKARLAHLRQLLDRQQQKAGKKQRTYLTAGLILTVACVISLATLTNMAFKLDAAALAQIGRLEVEKHLPQGRANLVGYLNVEAPRLVSHTLEALLDLLPHLRTSLVKDIDAKMERITAEGEARFREHMEETIRASKASIDAEFPDVSDAEKLEKLVAAVSTEFIKGMKVCLNELYPQYVSEMNRIHSFLEDLSTSDHTKLTPRQQTQKQLIQTLLKIMAHEGSAAVPSPQSSPASPEAPQPRP